MTKADLICRVAQVEEITKEEAAALVDTIFESVVHALRTGDKVEIRGFGTFRTRERRARVGRNPKTGDPVQVPAKRVPYFKPSKEINALLNPSADRPKGEPGRIPG